MAKPVRLRPPGRQARTGARRSTSAACLGLALALAGCGSGTTPAPSSGAAATSGPLRAAVVNAPLALFVERIGGEAVVVVFPCPADEDPAFWVPADEAIGQYADADLILRNGADYAKWMATASLPASRTVNTLADAKSRLIAETDGVTHSHGPAGEHSHAGTAFTTWLDFDLARHQAAAVRDALADKRPNLAPEFELRWGELDADLAALDLRMQEVGKALADRPIVASHPVYQYLARRYGLNIKAVHWEPGTIPSREEQENLVVLLRDFPATLMLWEGPPEPKLEEWLGALGIRCVVFEPCGNRPAAGTVLDAWRADVERLEAAARPAD